MSQEDAEIETEIALAVRRGQAPVRCAKFEVKWEIDEKRKCLEISKTGEIGPMITNDYISNKNLENKGAEKWGIVKN